MTTATISETITAADLLSQFSPDLEDRARREEVRREAAGTLPIRREDATQILTGSISPDGTADIDTHVKGCPWCGPDATGSAILSLFPADQPKLKALKLNTLKLSRAGAASSNPGGLWVTGRIRSDDEWTYLGSIRADGSIRMTREGAGAYWEGERETMKRLAAFGAAELARVGRATGSCCYCSRELTDPESISLGYGPICAEYHGLPHPNRHGF